MKKLLLAIFGLLALKPLMAAPGLDAPQPIGAYLNGVFPTSTPGPSGTWAVADAFPNLTFVDPVRMFKDPLSDTNVYVVCRNGEIWKVPFSASATMAQRTRFLDLKTKTWGYWDTGMTSMAFHPEFGVPGSPNRGYVYVFYQYIPAPLPNPKPEDPSYMRVSRFTVPDGSAVADPASEYVMIQQYDRHNWHSGGQLFFGPDGFLHIIIGDEGASNDSHGVCQKINDRLFSGILRIDVDNDPAKSHPIRRQPKQVSMPAGWAASFTQGYSIPNDNPWQDVNGGTLEEFWCIGTRSPYSMHYDRGSGNIWVAEVGQGAREEITIAKKGGNHQWPFKEGLANGPKAKPSPLIGFENPPIYDYGRSMGGCVIGGIVYRGTVHANSLTGKYIFGDHNTRALYALTWKEGQAATVEYLTSVLRSGGTKAGLSGICEGPDGEAYIMELGNTGANTGKIYKLVRNGNPLPDPPQLLSQTGAFSHLATLTPRAGLIPFDVNSPLWTDGAVKKRWIAIPNDGTHNTAAERVTYRDSGAWDFPQGTVLVKHFALPVDRRDPSIIRPVETRFLVKGVNSTWYGVTYRWNEAGTDATLLTSGEERDFTITETDGTTHVQTWSIPSRADCRTCHSGTAGEVLGIRSHQLAGDTYYPLTGRTANQLETWNALGIFGSSFGSRDPGALPRSVDPHDPHASLDHRVKSYLDANCAHCHHPGGVTANFDATFQSSLAAQNLVDGLINRPFDSPQEKVVLPGDPVLSLMHKRASLVGGGQMPPLGKNVVDEKAVALIGDWIRSLDRATFAAPPSHSRPPAANADSFSAPYAEVKPLDVLANDSDPDGPPGIHGVAITQPPAHGSVRIDGANKRLVYTHDGSANLADSFVYQITDPYGVSSAAVTVNLVIPFDFAAWTALTPGSGGSPSSNGDGDLYDDLLEFALGGDPASGDFPNGAPLSLDTGDSISLSIRRPAGLAGVEYKIFTSPDLATWTEGPAPEITSSGNLQTLSFGGLQQVSGLSATRGFVRLEVSLEGTSAKSRTLPLGWLGVDLAAGTRTLGVPFRHAEFSAKVESMAGDVLRVAGTPAVASGYVEITGGPWAGHRFEVASTAPGEIRLAGSGHTLSPVPDLQGAPLVLSSHHTLGGIFDKERFRGSTNPSTADQVQFYLNDGVGAPRFELFYLVDARPNHAVHEWRGFLPGGGDRGSRILPPGEAVFVKRPAGVSPVRLMLSGQVRGNAFRQPLYHGARLAASPFPLALTPRQRGLNDPAAGFTASTNISRADQFQLYQSGAFRIFYLLDHPTQPDPWREGVPGSPDYSDQPIFTATEGVFLKRNTPSPAYSVPLPWIP